MSLRVVLLDIKPLVGELTMNVTNVGSLGNLSSSGLLIILWFFSSLKKNSQELIGPRFSVVSSREL